MHLLKARNIIEYLNVVFRLRCAVSRRRLHTHSEPRQHNGIKHHAKIHPWSTFLMQEWRLLALGMHFRAMPLCSADSRGTDFFCAESKEIQERTGRVWLRRYLPSLALNAYLHLRVTTGHILWVHRTLEPLPFLHIGQSIAASMRVLSIPAD